MENNNYSMVNILYLLNSMSLDLCMDFFPVWANPIF